MVEEENIQVTRDNLESSSEVPTHRYRRLGREQTTHPMAQSERGYTDTRFRLPSLQKLRAQCHSRWSLCVAMFLLFIG